jgi:hypothetical protein
MRANPVAVPLRVLVILGARGRPLLGPLPALIIISVFTPPLMPPLCFFQGMCCAYPFEKKKGRLNIHFAKWILPPSQNIYTL